MSILRVSRRRCTECGTVRWVARGTRGWTCPYADLHPYTQGEPDAEQPGRLAPFYNDGSVPRKEVS